MLRVEAEALAPWQQAIAQAGQHTAARGTWAASVPRDDRGCEPSELNAR